MTAPARDLFITVRDGARLSARIWSPDGAGPWPALLEYIPYRKNDFTALRDSLRHPWFAAHGYACVRVDMRGSGDSDGLLLDEYLPLEQDDACDVIAWIAAQPWCTGAVGMFGKSWGGFNALQVAARRPPALRAIITIYSTDDRYADDVHYRGGAVLASEALSWATTMLAYNARPPDPVRRPDDWRRLWLERLEHTPPFADTWFAHQRRDAYWRQGSVAEDYAAIEIPVFAVGGWADGYTDPVLRLLTGLRVPRLGLIGPWVHEYPEVATPLLIESPWGPDASQPAGEPGRPTRVGFLQESLRWWDHWLKGIDNGILREPMLRAYLQDSDSPRSNYDVRAGRWTSAAVWPPEAVDVETLTLSSGAVPAALEHGSRAGIWCAYGSPEDPPGEQSAEDARCLTFDFAPVERVTAYLGFPELTARLIADDAAPQLVVRLCDVAPDGTSALVSTGVLKLSHRLSHANPAPVPPGASFDVRLRLDALGHRLLPGHHWRVALNQVWWPRMWPPARAAKMTLLEGTLSIPRHTETEARVAFEPADAAPMMSRTLLRPGHRTRVTSVEPDGVQTLVDDQDDGLVRLDDPGAVDAVGLGLAGLTFGAHAHDVYHVRPGDFRSPAVECRRRLTLGRDDWTVEVDAVGRMWLSDDARVFQFEHTLTVVEAGLPVKHRTWRSTVPID